ncbi:hypothetical protein [Longimicrobium sp.]|uniref:hypothetical protein n=1 Tax=Longimicrobium sp. TaxID=2029185 RepID=UPI003B3AAE8E
MDDERVNLSALDPARDPGRWRAVMEATMTRVDGVLLNRARPDPLALIAGWRRPLLAIAAATVLLLVPVEVALERRESHQETLRGLVDVSTVWAQEGRAPSGAELLRAIRTGAAR